MEAWMLSVFWGLVAVCALIAEVCTTALVSVWFVAGALCALAASLLGTSLLVQTGLFAGVSLLLFWGFRDWLAEHFAPKAGNSTMVGKRGRVTEGFENGAGRVSVSGKDWKAAGQEDLLVGTPVEVVSLQGVTLTVRRVEK